MTSIALEKLEEYAGSPFFLYFPLTAPHVPTLPDKKFLGKSGTNEYCDFILACDDIVGRINGKLQELGIEDNTIVIYTSDNGVSPRADFAELLRAGHCPNYVQITQCAPNEPHPLASLFPT